MEDLAHSTQVKLLFIQLPNHPRAWVGKPIQILLRPCTLNKSDTEPTK